MGSWSLVGEWPGAARRRNRRRDYLRTAPVEAVEPLLGQPAGVAVRRGLDQVVVGFARAIELVQPLVAQAALVVATGRRRRCPDRWRSPGRTPRPPRSACRAGGSSRRCRYCALSANSLLRERAQVAGEALDRQIVAAGGVVGPRHVVETAGRDPPSAPAPASTAAEARGVGAPVPAPAPVTDSPACRGPAAAGSVGAVGAGIAEIASRSASTSCDSDVIRTLVSSTRSRTTRRSLPVASAWTLASAKPLRVAAGLFVDPAR